ncbi:MAG: maleylpyruvate isomerase family mycothiol-dependent enzyme [Nocardioidaceae bacterium]
MTTRQSAQAPARTSALDRGVAMRLAAAEYSRVTDLLAILTPEQWAAPTECPGWDVRAMAGHVLGMAQMAASLPETVRQQLGSQRRAKRVGGSLLDALTALQVEKNAHLTTAEVVESLRVAGPKAVRSRRRTPGFVRARTMPVPQDVGDHQEDWTFGYLLDVILTRDPFLHRGDISRATGASLGRVDAGHEGVLVDDVVREWAGRHGSPFDLVLTGPAGGQWGNGGSEHLELDALEFCRVLSGRSRATGLLAERVPF